MSGVAARVLLLAATAVAVPVALQIGGTNSALVSTVLFYLHVHYSICPILLVLVRCQNLKSYLICQLYVFEDASEYLLVDIIMIKTD